MPLQIFICVHARKKAKWSNVDKGALYVKAMLGYSIFKCSQNAGRSCEQSKC